MDGADRRLGRLATLVPVLPAARHGLAALVDEQVGVVSRAQARAAGVLDRELSALVASGRWQRVHRGVYVVHTGPLPRAAVLWAAVLACGAGAAVSHATAAEVHGLFDDRAEPLDVTVPGDRRVRPPTGVRVHLAGAWAQRRWAGPGLPRTTVEDTVLDLVDGARRPGEVVDVVTRACQRRITTAARLAAAAGARPRLRHRRLFIAVVGEATAGVHSVLEHDYLVDVERAHGLPRGRRQVRDAAAGRVRWRDVEYADYGVLVELDGRQAHPAEARARDQWRDNEALLGRRAVTLRFGWSHVAGKPCATAAQIVAALRQGGWSGAPRACGPGCGLTRHGDQEDERRLSRCRPS